MPKFIITVIIATILVGTCLVFFINSFEPETKIKVFGFLFILWVFASLIFSLPFSFIVGKPKEKKCSPFELRCIYRDSLRRGMLLSFGLCTFLVTRYFSINSSQVYLAIFLFLIGIEFVFLIKK